MAAGIDVAQAIQEAVSFNWVFSVNVSRLIGRVRFFFMNVFFSAQVFILYMILHISEDGV